MLAIVPAVTTTTTIITIIFITANISGDQKTLAQSVEIRIHSTHLINLYNWENNNLIISPSQLGKEFLCDGQANFRAVTNLI